MREQPLSAACGGQKEEIAFNGERVTGAVSVKGKRGFAGSGNSGLKDLLTTDRMECAFIPLFLIPGGIGIRNETKNVGTLSRMVMRVELHEITRLKTADKRAVYLDLALSRCSRAIQVRRGRTFRGA